MLRNITWKLLNWLNDWWEEPEQRFYRPIPTAEEIEKIKQERERNNSSDTYGS